MKKPRAEPKPAPEKVRVAYCSTCGTPQITMPITDHTGTSCSVCPVRVGRIETEVYVRGHAHALLKQRIGSMRYELKKLAGCELVDSSDVQRILDADDKQASRT